MEYRQKTNGPPLLSAVRNIHAGILLLYKVALRRLSPNGSNDVPLMAKISLLRDPNGKVRLVGKGKKTADVHQIRERFEALGPSTDWKRFRQANEVRNSVECLFPHLEQKGLHALISNSFLTIRNFMAEELNDDPRDLLGDETWQATLQVSEVYEKEKEECDRLLDSVKWGSDALEEGITSLSCIVYGSDLLRRIENSHGEIILSCSSCGEDQQPESYVPKAIAPALRDDAYWATKDGGDTPYVYCPNRSAKTYVVEERRCALCEYEAEHTCQRCGNEIPPEELLSSPFCGWYDYMMNKDD